MVCIHQITSCQERSSLGAENHMSDVGEKLIHLLLCLVWKWVYKAVSTLKELPVEWEDRYLVRGTLVVFHLA